MLNASLEVVAIVATLKTCRDINESSGYLCLLFFQKYLDYDLFYGQD